MNNVYETEIFSKLYLAWEKKERDWIDKIKDQLRENLLVGKPLTFDWFREKKFENKRLYFLINKHNNKAVLVAFGAKKEQQKIINFIIVNKERFLKIIN